MKARQSSIYRKLENLLGALMAVSERVPKNAMGLQTAMSRCINEVVDSLVVCEYALRAIDINQRIAYIATFIHSLTIVKTIVRELHEYSRKEKSGMVYAVKRRVLQDDCPLFFHYFYIKGRFDSVKLKKDLNVKYQLLKINNYE